MVSPVPGYKVSTPYGKRGSYWSCNRNSAGEGIHTGADFAAPKGTPVVAARPGVTRHVSYGSAFGDRQIAVRCADGTEDFYAHLDTRTTSGKTVKAGDRIGTVGARGNVTGPHLHFERHAQQGVWNCGVVRDPKPSIDYAATAPEAEISPGNVYLSKLVYGQKDSDSVKRLQVALNAHSMPGGTNMPVTGNYGDMTDAEVRLCQSLHIPPADAAGKSNVGPKQAEHLFAGTGNTVIDDRNTAPPVEPPSPDGTTLGKHLAAAGFRVQDSAVPFGRASSWTGVKYVMVHHTASPDDGAERDIAQYVRTGGSFPPLAHIMLGQSGVVWMTCQELDGQPDPGRASHAGTGTYPGVPEDTMNQISIGIECQADGTKPLSSYPVMYAELIKLIAELCRKYAVPVDKVIGHKEWSNTGKKDPLDDMDKIRADVAAILSPQPPVDPEAPVDLFKYYFGGKPSGVQPIYTAYAEIDQSSFTPPGDGFLLSMVYVNAAHSFKTGVNEAGFRLRAVRAPHNGKDADYSGYGDFTPNRNLTKDGEFLVTHIWFEMCEGGRKIHWEIDRAAEFESFTLGTRYAKYVWVSSEVFSLLSSLLGGSKERVAGALASFLEHTDEPAEISL